MTPSDKAALVEFLTGVFNVLIILGIFTGILSLMVVLF